MSSRITADRCKCYNQGLPNAYDYPGSSSPCSHLLAPRFGAAQNEKALAQCRAQIDALGARIVAQLNDRAKLVPEVGRLKQQAGAPVLAPQRAQQVLQNAAGNSKGPLSADAGRRIHERIVEEMTAFEAAEMQNAERP